MEKGIKAANNDRSAWVLVGGRSSRMGRDKAFLDAGQGPLAAQIAKLAAGVCGTVTLVGDPSKYSSLGLPVVTDNHAGVGPLGGIEAALRATGSEWNLIVACDMPLLDTGIFELLFAAAEGCDCVLPRHSDGHVEPLCAVYNTRCHKAIATALDAGVRKVTDGLAGLTLHYLLTDREAAFANWNTPEDVAAGYRNQSHG